MSALRELQRRFQAGVLGETDAVLDRIAGSESAPPLERLEVYAQAVRLRFLEVLCEDFPGVHGLLGDDAFARLCAAYVQACPSTEHSIRWYGARLPDYLRDTPPWKGQGVLAEMAAFEWAKGELNDAADSPVAGFEQVAAVAPEQWGRLQPRPIAALRRLNLHWNVPPLWSALDRDEQPPEPARSEAPVAWLLWRRDLGLYWRSLDSHEAWALDACSEGADFEFLCEGLAGRLGTDAAPLRAATCLKQWLTDGVLTGV